MAQPAFLITSTPNWNNQVEFLLLNQNFNANGINLRLYTPNENDEFLDILEDIEYKIAKLYKEHGPVLLMVQGASLHYVLDFIQDCPQMIKAIAFINPIFDMNFMKDQIQKICVLEFEDRKKPISVEKLNYYLWHDKELYYKYLSINKLDTLTIEKYLYTDPYIRPQYIEKVIKIPSMMIFGEQDLLTNAVKSIAFAQGKFSQFKSKIYPNSGHYCHLEKVKEFITDMLELSSNNVQTQKSEIQTQIIS